MKYLFTLSFVLIAYLGKSANINYEVAMSKPYTHYYEVKMTVIGYQKDYFDIKMPVWAPGSYLIREFAKSVEKVNATFNKKLLKTEKINKNTWRIYADKAKKVNITYKVYAFEQSVRTSYLDASHGYFNGTSMFMFIEALKKQPSKLIIHPYKNWKKVSTSLPKTSEKGFVYQAPNYDILVDSPFEIGNQVTFDFTSAGVIHHVAMYGKGNYNIEKLKVDMAKITQAATNVFGFNPNKEYTFIIHNLTYGSGGLEHLSSTTLDVNRWTYGKDDYKGFLSLVAHEYFHLWNVKRIRPTALGPFNYNKENYTHLLWVMEGFTSYYAKLLLYRAGYYNEEEIVHKFNSSINSIENRPGDKVQPVAQASFDAWIKSYRPNENTYNTTISYYTKGSVIANMLDLIIIKQTKGKKNLDNLMQYLYNEYYLKKQRGFSAQEFQNAVSKITGLNMASFFEKYVNGTQTFNYKEIFGYAGLSVKKVVDDKTPYFGVSTSGNVVKSVYRGSSAYDGGINANDEILAIDGFRVNNNITDFIKDKKVGDVISVLLSRNNIIKTISFSIKARNSVNYYIFKDSEKNNIIHQKWLHQQ